MQTQLTERALAKQTVLGRGGLWRWILELGGGRSARLAHRVCAMHLEEGIRLFDRERGLVMGIGDS